MSSIAGGSCPAARWDEGLSDLDFLAGDLVPAISHLGDGSLDLLHAGVESTIQAIEI